MSENEDLSSLGSIASILLVDDEPTMRKLFERIMESEGHSVDMVDNGSDAIEQIEKEVYNLLIVDNNLPDMSGMEVILRARAIQPTAEIIMITAYASYESAVAALRLGVFDYLEKPFSDVAIVAEKISRALEKEKLSRQNRALEEQLEVVKDAIDGSRRITGLDIEEELSGDVEQVALYVNETVERATREIREELARFQHVVEEIERYSWKLKLSIDRLAVQLQEKHPALEEIEESMQRILSLAKS